MIYTPDSATHVRLAGWKNLDDAAVGNASLAPATLAGIVLNRPGDTYKLVQGLALDADRQLDALWLLEGHIQRRWTDDPRINSITNEQILSRRQIDDFHVALHWQPESYPFNVALAYNDESIWNDPNVFQSNSLQEQRLRSQQLNSTLAGQFGMDGEPDLES